MADKALEKHLEWQGKIEIALRCPMETKEDLSLAYTPGVAMPCLAIKENPDLSFSLTRRGNTVAVVTDGTAVLGLGDIGLEMRKMTLRYLSYFPKAFWIQSPI